MGKTDLGKWMITNGGEYSADATYEQLTMVKYGNSTYITLKTVTGITPTDDKINYQLMAQGFDATALSAVQAEDTQGLCGEKGEIVTAQSLVDALADKVMNTVMAKIGTAALTGGMTDLSSGINALYSNLQHGSVTITLAVNKEEERTITFPHEFSKQPTVLIGLARSGYTSAATVMVRKNSVGTSGFKYMTLNTTSNNAEVEIYWLAIAI
nr:MAG TPA: H-type lectin domain [Caudoviricetes sp.]